MSLNLVEIAQALMDGKTIEDGDGDHYFMVSGKIMYVDDNGKLHDNHVLWPLNKCTYKIVKSEQEIELEHLRQLHHAASKHYWSTPGSQTALSKAMHWALRKIDALEKAR